MCLTVFWVTNRLSAVSRFVRPWGKSGDSDFAGSERFDARECGPAWPPAGGGELIAGSPRRRRCTGAMVEFETSPQRVAGLRGAAVLADGGTQVDQCAGKIEPSRGRLEQRAAWGKDGKAAAAGEFRCGGKQRCLVNARRKPRRRRMRPSAHECGSTAASRGGPILSRQRARGQGGSHDARLPRRAHTSSTGTPRPSSAKQRSASDTTNPDQRGAARDGQRNRSHLCVRAFQR